MPSLILPCTFDELPRDIRRFLQKGVYRKLNKHGNPPDEVRGYPITIFALATNLGGAYVSTWDKVKGMTILYPSPFDNLLFPLELLAKPEYKGFIKEDHSKSLEHLQKWQHDMWQDNERQLASVPNGYRENGMLRFRENERQYNKQAEEIRHEIDKVFSGKGERTQEVREFLSKKEEFQKQWFDKFLEMYERKFGYKYHTDIITV